MIIPFRATGWLLDKLLSEGNRSKVIRQALTDYYRRRRVNRELAPKDSRRP